AGDPAGPDVEAEVIDRGDGPVPLGEPVNADGVHGAVPLRSTGCIASCPTVTAPGPGRRRPARRFPRSPGKPAAVHHTAWRSTPGGVPGEPPGRTTRFAVDLVTVAACRRCGR